MLAEFIDDLKCYQELLDETKNPSLETLQAIVNDLNAHWPYHDQSMCVNGQIDTWLDIPAIPGDEAENDDYDYAYGTVYADDFQGISRGVIIHDTDNDEDTHGLMIGYLFEHGEEKDNSILMLGLTRTFYGVAHPAKVHLSGYQQSKEYAQNIVEFYLPDEMGELRERIFNTNDGDWLTALKDMELRNDRNIELDAYTALETFVNRHYDVSANQLPVILNIDEGKECQVFEDDKFKVTRIQQAAERYGYLAQLKLQNVHTLIDEDTKVDSDTTVLIWNLETSVRVASGEWMDFVLPLSVIKACRELSELSS